MALRTFALLLGVVLGFATMVWFFYFVPLGCAMNTTGCRETFSVWSRLGLVHFWAPFLVALAAVAYGLGRR
ncbi:hypothetical protein AOPFMNJM_2667 [Methylobacterium jeotgali]|uniref:Transmembrane protein n=3 Tax=Pseudomonadota TaxID=1224 RepID=A0ABQ4SXS5_9HYPH|nr:MULTISPECIES: hypothetical protein [Methylobacterium]GBU19314.1 hypothetical protein AwMethylo_35290 [Methylobacterium sp.]GJE07339.1 hypothetical protein AOPFMNJM_2667 [Methylobacterium jeotgali]